MQTLTPEKPMPLHNEIQQPTIDNNIESLHSLSNTRLPVLPTGIPEFLTLLMNDDTSIIELSYAIEQFPSITARLIAVANSAWSSPIEPVKSLSAACSRLGFSIVKSISIALAVASPFSLHRCPSFDMPRFWCRALLSADIASSLSYLTDKETDSEIVRTAGLLHNLGLLWLADQMPDLINTAFLQQNKPDSSLHTNLKQTLGFDYADAGAFLSKEWRLPDSLNSAIEYQLNPAFYLNECNNSSILGHAVALAQAAEENDHDLIPETLVKSLELSPQDVDKQFYQASLLLKKNQSLARILF